MNKDIITKSILFRGLSEEEKALALKGMKKVIKKYKKNETVFHAGTKISKMGLVLSGSITILSDDMWGNRTILSQVPKGQFFGETYAILNDTPLLVDAMSNEDSAVCLLDLTEIVSLSSKPEAWKYKIQSNLLFISAKKNLMLSSRSFYVSPKKIRGRVMAYLNAVSLQKNSLEFDIPFDRQQLADYLNLERTALSKELGKMQKDGILKTNRKHFIIIDKTPDI